jgi:hypothetical protein
MSFETFLGGGLMDNSTTNILLLVVLCLAAYLYYTGQYKTLLNEGFAPINHNLGKCSKIDTNICSKACCFQQYPVPFNKVVDPLVPDPTKYERSNYMCNWGGNGSGGCVCITKKQKNWLGARAGNTSYAHDFYPPEYYKINPKFKQ